MLNSKHNTMTAMTKRNFANGYYCAQCGRSFKRNRFRSASSCEA